MTTLSWGYHTLLPPAPSTPNRPRRSTIVPGSPARSSMSSGGRVTTLSVQTEELESYALSQTSFPELVRRCSVSSHTVAMDADFAFFL